MVGNGKNNGLVLVMVLWIVTVLVTVVAVVGRTSRLNTKVAVGRMDELRCKWACRAGMETAIGILNEDLRASDSLTDLWSDNDEDFNDVMLEGCRFSVRAIDEAGKLNINTITREQLMGLPYMEDRIADAILDWRDQDDTPTGEGVEGGYYENLPFRYTIRNGPFRTIRELLLVRDVTEELFYGEDTNLNGQLDYNERDRDENPPADDGDDELDEGWIAYLTCYSYDKDLDADGSQRVNVNRANEGELEKSLGIKRAQARWIVENRAKNQYQSIADLVNENSPKQPQEESKGKPDQTEPMDLQTFSQMADKITVSNGGNVPGRVNINTAPEEVLTALLGGTEADRELAQGIIAYRASLLDGMQSIAEVMSVQSMKLETFKRIANYITVRSDVFAIRCVATADRGGTDGATVQSEAVVDRSLTPCKILYLYQGASN